MIDARGLACPMPVLMTQKEIAKNSPAKLEVMVDNHSARENVNAILPLLPRARAISMPWQWPRRATTTVSP